MSRWIAFVRSMIFLTFLAVVCLGDARSALASCGGADCPLDVSHQGSPAQPETSCVRGTSLQVVYDAIDQDQLRAGTRKVQIGEIRRPDHDEIETLNRNVRLLAGYTFSPRWSAGLSLPVAHRYHAHIAHHHHEEGHGAEESGVEAEGEVETWNFTALGDLTLRGRYKPWATSDRGDLSVGIGVSLPTGSTRVKNHDGEMAEPSLQPGRGNVGVMAEVSFQRLVNVPTFSGRGTARFFASSYYRLNRSGKEAYRFGSEWLVHMGGHYPLFRKVELLGQMVSRRAGRDEPGETGELTDATGGSWVYLSPGLQVDLISGLSLYSYIQLPLYQKVNGVQLTADRNLLFGLSYRLSLF